ncbi:MAG: KH domain-containing protein [Oscillospiraceae bacterium]|jgi:spoIIIJ-associated protein|nr:KH domain-containing protein [Oscillospiraceae bacterium]
MEKKFSGKSLEEARAQAYEFYAGYSVDEHDVSVSIIEQPVKKLFGTKGEYLISASADVPEVTASAPQSGNTAVGVGSVQSGDYSKIIAYIEKILSGLGADDFHINVIEKEDAAILDIVGDKLGIVIGRRGETLDSLQYLAVLSNNRKSSDNANHKRISVDCNGYREKRRETLETLATRTANKVLKQGRRVTLEPMNPYERRIIHSKVAEVGGVFSSSIGEEPFRKVVISANVPKPRGDRDNRRDNRDSRDDRGRRDNRDRPISSGRSYKQSSGFSTSFEREYKRMANPSDGVEISQDTVDFEKNASVGKIEL